MIFLIKIVDTKYLLLQKEICGIGIFLSEQNQKAQKKKKKNKKKKKQQIVLETEVESELPDLIDALIELEKEKKHVDIQICPHCKSTKVQRVDSMQDALGNMGIAPPKYVCKKCGWCGKLLVKATNKPTTVKDVVLMAEANEAQREKD